MSIFILTAFIVIVFFPLIYFIWYSFISMLYMQWRIRRAMKDAEKNGDGVDAHGLPIYGERPAPKSPKRRVETGVFNFITADEYIDALMQPNLSERRLQAILEDLGKSHGLIRRDQQEDLQQLLTALEARAKRDKTLKPLIAAARAKLKDAQIIG